MQPHYENNISVLGLACFNYTFSKVSEVADLLICPTVFMGIIK
jgi:hypothetical protein